MSGIWTCHSLIKRKVHSELGSIILLENYFKNAEGTERYLYDT